MDREAARIRGLVWAAGPRGRGARCPEGTRRELIAFARRRWGRSASHRGGHGRLVQVDSALDVRRRVTLALARAGCGRRVR